MMLLFKLRHWAPCLVLPLLFSGLVWARSQSSPDAPPSAGASVLKETTSTEKELEERQHDTLKLVRQIESISRTDVSYDAYKEQLAETKKEVDVALKDAPDDVLTFEVRNAMEHYQRAAELLQFVAESKNSAFIYRQKADALLQIYVGKYKKVRRSDKLSDRRADLVDAPLSQIWKEASDFLAQAQEYIDKPNK